MKPIFYLHGIESMPVFSTVQDGFDLKNLHNEGNALAFVIDAKGWLVSRRNEMFEGLVRIKDLEGIDSLKESVYFVPSKIPAELMDQIVAFFRAVYKRQKSEAAGLLLYNDDSSVPEKSRWEFVVPEQTATGGSADYHGDRELVEPFLNQGFKLSGTVHSHGSMGAFHSGTDHKDEEGFDGLHITVGHLDQQTVEFAISIVLQGKRFKFDKISDVVDYKESIVSVPENWLQAVKEKIIPAKKETLVLENAYAAFESGQISFGQLAAEINEQELTKKSKGSKKSPSRPFFDVRRYSRWSEG